MTEVIVKFADTSSDFTNARLLCRQWLDWHWKVFPEDGPRVGNPMDPVAFQDVLDNLEHIHARPKGAILVAEVDGSPAGCVMYHKRGTGVAEIKRLFVNEAGRGHGLGRMLLDRMFEAMIADGYQTVLFSSARFLTHARQLYESVGFESIPHPDDFPEDKRDFVLTS